MKTIKSTILLCVLCLAALPICAQKTKGKTVAAPKTVTDFYLLLPSKYLSKTEELSASRRKALIETEDVKNGYLRLSSKKRKGWTEIALFKKKSGGYLIAASLTVCEPECSSEINFSEYRNGKFKEVDGLPRYTYNDTRDAFFGATERQPTEEEIDRQVFELPREGKEITLKMANVPIMGFLWTGVEFVSGMIYLRDGK